MQKTPFHVYTMARALDSLPDEHRFLSVFASSDIRVYPFQIAAAGFALRSPYQKGVVLCDESGLGKSHEAMLVITQRWLEGKRRLLLAVPNADLLHQWLDLIQTQYTIPYVVLAGREDWEQNVSNEHPNAFIQDALVLTTYDFLANRQAAAREVKWELIVFEEATALSSVYEEDGRQAAVLKAIAEGSFKLLLTGTPIEKNIMDLYGLLFNTLKMEQRIDRCHRLNQPNDVVTIAFIDKNNFADVRKLELVNKRLLVSDGVFGVSDAVVGGFTDSLEPALSELKSRARTKEQVEADYRQTLAAHEAENKQTVANAEDILFTTFTGELSGKVTVTPQYVEEQAKVLNDRLWELSKFFFRRYNETHEDCVYEIDDAARTVTATRYETLPCLFYYWSGGGSRKYISQKRYGMTADFKPRHGRITLTSILGQGILHELECADSGALAVEADIQPYTIALYTVELQPSSREVSLLTGKTASGTILSDEQCREILRLPVVCYTESEHKAPHWLRTSSGYHELDRTIPIDRLLEQESAALSPAQAEEIDRMKLRAKTGKSALSRALGELEQQVKAAEQALRSVSGDRMQTLALNRKLSLSQRELGQKRETRFFEEMQLELELEKQIEMFLGRQKASAKAVRQFVIEMEGRK